MKVRKFLFAFFTLNFLTLCSDGKIDNIGSQDKNDKAKISELQPDINTFLQGPPALAKAKNCENVIVYLSTLIGAQIERMKNIDVSKIKRGGAETTVLLAQEEVSTNFSQYFVGEPQPEFSETNVLERGIDEADIVKTDGKYI